MGVRAVQHLGVQHLAHVDVIDKRRVALGEFERVDLVLRLAHHIGLGHLGVRNHLGSPCGNASGSTVSAAHIVSERRDQRVLDGGHRLSPQCGGCHLDRDHRTVITGLTVENARKGVADLVVAWIRVASNEFLGGQDLRRCRVSRTGWPLRPRRLPGSDAGSSVGAIPSTVSIS